MPEMNHRGYRLHVEGVPGAQATVRLEGRLALENLQPLMADLQAVPGRLKPRKIAVDVAGVEYLDSAGALALIEMENLSRSLGIPFELLGVSEKDHGLLCLIDREAMQRPPLRPESERLSIVVKLGELARRQYRDFLEVMSFVGELVTALAFCLVHPRSIRWGEVKFYMKRAGAAGFPSWRSSACCWASSWLSCHRSRQQRADHGIGRRGTARFGQCVPAAVRERHL